MIFQKLQEFRKLIILQSLLTYAVNSLVAPSAIAFLLVFAIPLLKNTPQKERHLKKSCATRSDDQLGSDSLLNFELDFTIAISCSIFLCLFVPLSYLPMITK